MESTRYYSDRQEKQVCKDLGARQQPSSGSGKFRKGDVLVEGCCLVECKTCEAPKESFSIKKSLASQLFNYPEGKLKCLIQFLE